MKKLKNLGKKALVAGGLALVAGCSPEIQEVRDFTGDGKDDIMMYKTGTSYLFIQQDDGKYLTTVMRKPDAATYFQANTEDGKRFFFYDGEFYRESPQAE